MQTDRTFDLNTSNDPEPIKLIIGETDFLYLKQLIDMVFDKSQSMPEQKLESLNDMVRMRFMQGNVSHEFAKDMIEMSHFFAEILLMMEVVQPMVRGLHFKLPEVKEGMDW